MSKPEEFILNAIVRPWNTPKNHYIHTSGLSPNKEYQITKIERCSYQGNSANGRCVGCKGRPYILNPKNSTTIAICGYGVPCDCFEVIKEWDG